MIIADSSANPAWIAADLLAQAEHDLQATAILLTPDKRLAQEVQTQVQQALGESFSEFLAQNPREAKIIVQKCLTSARARDAARWHSCRRRAWLPVLAPARPRGTIAARPVGRY